MELLALLLLGFVTLTWVECKGKSKVLESKRILDRGDWGLWEECPAGSHAMGFQLKVEHDQDKGDDTAINGICLYCSEIHAPMMSTGYIISTEGRFGRYRTKFFCDDGFVNGFDLRVEPGGNDVYGATNFRAYCSNLPKNNPIEGDGFSYGSWGGPKFCKKKQAVCAMRTQVQPYKDNQDDTSLNNVDLRCCDIPSPAKTCKPEDRYVDLVKCDNLGGVPGSGPDYFLNCTYEQTIGATTGSTTSTSSFTESEVTTSLGFQGTAALGGLMGNIIDNLDKTSTTGGNWKDASIETFSKATTVRAFFTVPPGSKVILQQAVATCGNIYVGSSHFRLRLASALAKFPYPCPTRRKGITFWAWAWEFS